MSKESQAIKPVNIPTEDPLTYIVGLIPLLQYRYEISKAYMNSTYPNDKGDLIELIKLANEKISKILGL